MLRQLFVRLLAISLIALAPATAGAEDPVAAPAIAMHHGMVVAQEARAARVGVEVLQKGGNAIDAAVATAFAMAVTYPRAGNIGGGGYMVIHLAQGSIDTTIDYRETAPAATTRDIFLNEKGDADPQKSRDSALAIGVPGTVAGLALAHAKYGSGKFTLADLLAPAIAFARDGIPVETDVADSLPSVQARLARWPASAKIFLNANGHTLGPGDTLLQRDLADTLAAIARDGPRAFYEGATADKIAAAVQAAGGLMTRDDLANYRPIERPPVRGSYRGLDLISMPPSSSGGVILLEILNILEGYPDFASDDARRARPAAEIRPALPAPHEGHNTTHFSVVDGFGNAVSNTYTLNFSYGVGLVAEGTGILLNNELDDFAAKPGAPNAFGLLGGEANAPGPGKRPLSSMTPTIVLRDGKPFIVTGSPGGSRIITTVLQVISNVIDRKLSITDAVAAPRLHHQWMPDQVLVERGFSPELIRALTLRGHRVVEAPPGTSANSIMVTPDGFVGAADPRTRGSFAAGY
jgi:gamma-glutamyltranspeptidase/glutathione hydrolase